MHLLLSQLILHSNSLLQWNPWCPLYPQHLRLLQYLWLKTQPLHLLHLHPLPLRLYLHLLLPLKVIQSIYQFVLWEIYLPLPRRYTLTHIVPTLHHSLVLPLLQLLFTITLFRLFLLSILLIVSCRSPSGCTMLMVSFIYCGLVWLGYTTSVMKMELFIFGNMICEVEMWYVLIVYSLWESSRTLMTMLHLNERDVCTKWERTIVLKYVYILT
jgi:hypothetical protein